LDIYPGFKVRPGTEPDLRFRFRFSLIPPEPEPNRTVASLGVADIDKSEPQKHQPAHEPPILKVDDTDKVGFGVTIW
jgi:hypothetical protein